MNTSFAPDFSPNNGMYPNGNQMFDPSMFGGNQNIDVNRLQGAPNGAMSPAFNNNQASYQVNQVVPSKRPRPNEENAGASPRPGSRSQTPHTGPFPGYQGNLQAHTPFQHLQQGGSQNATPSPTMSNQQFRPPGAPPQRVNTVSPNPNANQYPQQGMGMSPPNGPGSRVGTPQNHNMGQMGQMGFMPGGGSMPQGFNQNFAAQGGMPQGMQGNMPVLPQHLANKSMDVQREYQMRLQQQQASLAGNMGAQQQQRFPGGMNPMFNGQQGRPQGMPPGGVRQGQPTPQMVHQQFLGTVAKFMQQNSRPFNHQPVVCGQPVPLMKLFQLIARLGGSNAVTQNQQWPQVANQMGYMSHQFPSAPSELKYAFEANLGPYEAYTIARTQQSKAQSVQGQMPGQPQMSPTRQMPGTPQQQNLQAQQHAQYMQQLQRGQPGQQDQNTPARNMSASSANGWSTPQPDQTPTRPPNAMNQQHRKSMSRQLEGTPPHGQVPGFPTPSPGPESKTFDRAPTSEPTGPTQANGVPKEVSIKVEHGTEYQPKVQFLADTHGGYPVEEIGKIGEEIARMKPNVPMVEEMGAIDIRALSLGIQSGINSEIRLALDCLSRVTCDPRLQVNLDYCEDLIDVLIDCAEEQVDALMDGAVEVSDIIDLNSYEDVIRHSRQEIEGLQDIPEVGTPEYDLERSADRLLAITVILRNLSFFECNHRHLSTSNIVKFLSNTIRLIGTRILLLRNHVNTCEFMKDILVFFSNTTHAIELPSREDALSILHFLLAFAPCPPPNDPIRFTPYDPSIHKYLPAAVDCLAKLLARDEPNRAFYKAIFSQDATSSPAFDLLSRSFALAISVAPRAGRMNPRLEVRISEARKPYLTQGMLAADIIASLAPGAETGIARAWLEAEDGWAVSLVRFAFLLLSEHGPPQPPGPPPGHRGPHRPDIGDQGFHQITHRALNMLKRLAEKCGTDDVPQHLQRELKDADGDADMHEADEAQERQVNGARPDRKLKYSGGLVPKIETLMGALMMQTVDGVGLSKLVKFGDLIE